jgi:signal transduction histidine kinase
MEDQVVGAIHMGQPLRDVTAVLADLRTRLLLVLVIALPLSALIAMVLARNIAHPLRKLTVAADRLSRGDYDYPLDTSGSDELGQLSRTFSNMRQQLQAEERTRTQFVSDVSHELRTPLTAIKGLAETLRDGAVDDPKVRDNFLASVEDETDRLIRLVNDLLILTRADSKALPLNLKDVDLREVVRETIDRLKPQAATKEVKLLADFPDTPLRVNADQDRIQQVLLNLLDNAIKHTDPKREVRVRCEQIDPLSASKKSLHPQDSKLVSENPSDRWVAVHVIDDGAGIDPADLSHVFDRFYRADQSRSRGLGGSGLGLSIAKAIIEAHQGSIWLESPPLSVKMTAGTKATFVLPSP